MKLKYFESGDMIVYSNQSWFWLSILICLLSVNFVAGGYAMATTRMSSWGPNIYIQLPVLAVAGFYLGRAMTRKSEFYFDSKQKVVSYFVQSFWSEDRGIINTNDIVEIKIQKLGSDEEGERLAIVCEKKIVPMTLMYTNIINFSNIKNDIDVWILKNGSA